MLFGYENPAESGRWFFGDDDYNAGWVRITLPPDAGGATVGALRKSLGDTGWDVTGADGVSLQANRGDLVVDVEAAESEGPSGPALGATLAFQRAEPPTAAAGTLLDALLGLLIGWAAGLLTASRGRGGMATAAGLVLLPVSLVVLLSQTLGRFGPDAGLISPDSAWWPYLTFPYQACAVAGGVLALITVLLAVIPRRSPAARSKPGRTTWNVSRWSPPARSPRRTPPRTCGGAPRASPPRRRPPSSRPPGTHRRRTPRHESRVQTLLCTFSGGRLPARWREPTVKATAPSAAVAPQSTSVVR